MKRITCVNLSFKGAGPPHYMVKGLSHPRSLISNFIVRCLDRIIHVPVISRARSSVGYADGRGLDPYVRLHSFVEFDHENISTAILAIPLFQERQLSVTGERLCTRYW